MSDDLTPQERLKRYKAYLAKLAKNEGRILKCCMKDMSEASSSKDSSESIRGREPKSVTSKSHKTRDKVIRSKDIPKKKTESISKHPSKKSTMKPTYGARKDPNRLVSPAKRELREAGIDLKSEPPSLVPDGTPPERKRVMLIVKKRSVESRLVQLKRERDALERDFSRKKISEDYYRSSLTRLIRESRELQKEKKEVEEALKR
ncbi:MAG: hypothetical protein GF411_16680 [Candidatus Lokiarchaeota archaeon]|nr:hypothetical protein [Candidatus Lokiarchaeota archaeon]